MVKEKLQLCCPSHRIAKKQNGSLHCAAADDGAAMLVMVKIICQGQGRAGQGLDLFHSTTAENGEEEAL